MTQEEKDNKVKAFLDAYEQLCKFHELSISHQDSHGAFIIENYNEYNINWVKEGIVAVTFDYPHQKGPKDEDY